MQFKTSLSTASCATAGLLTLALATNCSLTDVTISDQKASAVMTISSESSSYEGEISIAAADLDGLAKHKDRIKGGSVEKIYIKILETLDGNEATTATLRGKVRVAGSAYADGYDWSLSDYDLSVDSTENGDELPLTPAQFERITQLLFPDGGTINNLEIMLEAEADGAPNLKARITIVFDAVAETI